MSSKKTYNYTWFLRVALKRISILLVLFLVLLLFIRSPWGQNFIVSKATHFISSKTNTKVDIEKLYITLGGNLMLKEVYLEDKSKDTLVYSKELEAGIDLLPLLTNPSSIRINYLNWEGLKANIYQNNEIDGFNYQFLIDSFSSSKTTEIDSNTTNSPTLYFHKIKLKDIQLNFKDVVSGTFAEVNLGDFSIKKAQLDLEEQIYEINDIKLNNSKVNFEQTKITDSNNETATQLPVVKMKSAVIKNFEFNYNATPVDLRVATNVSYFKLQMPLLDLEKQLVRVENIELQNSKIQYQQIQNDNPQKDSIGKPSDFEWPTWKVAIKKLRFNNNTITAKTSSKSFTSNVFNPEYIKINQFDVLGENINYAPKNVSATIENIHFIEQSGFKLKKLKNKITVTDNQLQVKGLSIKTNFNEILGSANLQYESLDALLKKPKTTSLNIELNNLILNPKDAYYFLPKLKENTTISALTQKNITGNILASGTLNELNIPSINLNWGNSSKIAANGIVKNLQDPQNINATLENIQITSTKKDIETFIALKNQAFTVPNTMHLIGNLSGNQHNLVINLKLETTDGTASIQGNFKNKNKIAINANLGINELNLKKILNNEKLGTYSFKTKVSASGNTLNTLNGKLETNFDKLPYNNYDFSKLQLNGSVNNGNGIINLKLKDENIDTELISNIKLDTINPKFDIKLNVEGVNLQSLGFTNDDIRTKFNLNTMVEGKSIDNLNFEGTANKIIAIKNNQPYLIGDIIYNGKLKKDSTYFNFESNPLQLLLKANTSIENLWTAVKEDLTSHFDKDTLAINNATGTVVMKLEGKLKEAPILNELLLPKLTSFQPASINVSFTEKEHSLIATLNTSEIIYDNNSIDNFDFSINGNKEKIDFNISVDAIKTNAIATDKISFGGHLEHKLLYTKLKAFQEEQQTLNISTKITKVNDTTKIHIDPNGFMLNKQNWDIATNNKIKLTENYLDFEDVLFSYNNQKIDIHNTINSGTNDQIDVEFSNFKLSTITKLLNTGEVLASGKLNGIFSVKNISENMGIAANATINDFQIKEVPLGLWSFDATTSNNNAYKLKVTAKGENLNMNIGGNYLATNKDPLLDFKIDLENLRLKAIEKFTENSISDTSGYLSGTININGNIAKPTFLGEVHFNDADIRVNALNSNFKLPKESIQLKDSKVVFNDFKMLDTQNNPFTIDGTVTTEDLSNPTFNLKLKAKNLEVLNATNEDNELFYGKVNLDTDISIKGDLNLPEVRGKLSINETSNFTYVIPEDQVDIIEKEGVVQFVNKKNPNDILTKQNDDSPNYEYIKGYDIDLNLKVEPKATFNIIVSERTGDNLKVTGNGKFNFGISPNGEVALSGKYEVNDGHYEVSLYNLIKKRFDIDKGSSIVWRGNPLDADMDIRAIYKVETSASGLIASQLTSEDRSVANQFQQKLPFLVYLNLDGELLKPEISFDINLPKDKRGELGGKVYSQLQQLNTQEQELNKQVFSLLVLNQFFPTTTNDGSNGGSLSIARDNANNILSDQLNNFSDKIFGKSGFELDFDLDSYTDYQGNSTSNRTQLDINARKKLFNNRLIVEVGSGVDIQEGNQNTRQNTPLIGTVNIQYLIDDKGRWRLKGYRKNEFESVIEGQVILTGIALIFNQEFNKFEELFAKSVQNELEKQSKENTSSSKDSK